MVSMLLAWVGCMATAAEGGAIEELSLEGLLNEPTSVASAAVTTAEAGAALRAAPGVLTVITHEEIERLGLRDLQDALHLVAGFHLGQDVTSATGVGLRGLWAYEGKMLVMVDGIELTEPLYGTSPLGQHLLLHHLDRIEIIRGPGSVVYGGNAELAVVNLISRAGKDLHGGSARVDYGLFADGQGSSPLHDYARRNLQLHWGDMLGPVEISAAVALGEGNRSDRLVHDLSGSPPFRGIGGNARLDPFTLNLAARWQDWQLRVLIDRYRLTDRYPTDTLVAAPIPVDFTTYAVEAKGQVPLSASLSLAPRLVMKAQNPWRSTDQSSADSIQDYYDKRVARLLASARLIYAQGEALRWVLGYQGQFDWARVRGPLIGLNLPFIPGRHVAYRDHAGFAEVNLTSAYVNAVLGARFEHHSAYGSAFVPRLALTKAFGRAHAKALVSNAFRFPAIENISLNPKIKPERSVALELELGWVIAPTLYASVNAFDTAITMPMAYSTDGDGNEHYNNFPHAGARGVELELRWRTEHHLAGANYSFYTTQGHGQVAIYDVPGSHQTLAFPSHKVAAFASLRLMEGLFLAPSAIFLGPRHGYVTTADDPPARVRPTLLANLVLTWRDGFARGLDLSLGVYNIFDGVHALGDRFGFVQPYRQINPSMGGRAPLPGLTREVLASARYTFE